MSAHEAKINQELVKQFFDYQDGKLFWKISRTNSIKVGDEAGTLNKVGYRQIGLKINNKKAIFATHRLIYLYHYGFIPKEVDHINLVKTDNRIENLREATRSQNNINRLPRSDNKSGVSGVYFCKKSKLWIARLWINKKCVWMQKFNTLEEAAEVRHEKNVLINKDFARKCYV